MSTTKRCNNEGGASVEMYKYKYLGFSLWTLWLLLDGVEGGLGFGLLLDESGFERDKFGGRSLSSKPLIRRERRHVTGSIREQIFLEEIGFAWHLKANQKTD
jgi:hypothetical protein